VRAPIEVLHADWAHLLGNLVFLLIFGLPAERVASRAGFRVLAVRKAS
jgi:membrane associated rhomboid family serine protease